jgi:hypothetical protein
MRVEPGLKGEAQDVLEVGQAVVAAESHIVAEEGEHQREGHGLGDDRQVNAGDAGAKGEPAEGERKRAWHEQHHQGREGKPVEPVPEPWQFLPVQEHHKIGKDRVGIDPARPDLAHEVHAHGIAAKGEEGSVPEGENAAETPDQIDGQRQQGEADIFAQKRHEMIGEMQGRVRRGEAVHGRHQNRGGRKQRQDDDALPVEGR